MAQTHFGYQNVDEADKARRVRGVFDSVARSYDLMNDLMSLGLHRAWKAYTVAAGDLSAGKSRPSRSFHSLTMRAWTRPGISGCSASWP